MLGIKSRYSGLTLNGGFLVDTTCDSICLALRASHSQYTNVNFVGLLANGIATMDRDHEGHNGWRIDEVNAQIAGWLASNPPDTASARTECRTDRPHCHEWHR